MYQKCVFQKKQKTCILKLQQQQNIFCATVNANSIAQHVIQNKNEIIKYVNVNVKIIVVEILAHAFLRIVSI